MRKGVKGTKGPSKVRAGGSIPHLSQFVRSRAQPCLQPQPRGTGGARTLDFIEGRGDGQVRFKASPLQWLVRDLARDLANGYSSFGGKWERCAAHQSKIPARHAATPPPLPRPPMPRLQRRSPLLAATALGRRGGACPIGDDEENRDPWGWFSAQHPAFSQAVSQPA